MKLNVNRVRNVEGGCFAVLNQNRGNVYMTYDWLDFAVEHMSKWWKVLGIFKDDIPYNMVINKFQAHVKKVQRMSTSSERAMQNTIAVIAF